MINMKSFNIILVFLIFFGSALTYDLEAQQGENYESEENMAFYGDSFELNDANNSEQVLDIFSNMTDGETSPVKFRGEVSSVCQVKGCWMVLELEGDEQLQVTFKDYSFFVPTDIVGKEVVVKGEAMVAVISEEERRHYAKDAGKSEEEIQAITGSKKSYALTASGVMIEN